jgi:hypothetical protein
VRGSRDVEVERLLAFWCSEDGWFLKVIPEFQERLLSLLVPLEVILIPEELEER